MNADEPWQALSCCMEIAKAVRSPDPAQFISNFPIHQVLQRRQRCIYTFKEVATKCTNSAAKFFNTNMDYEIDTFY